jgi:hypothetical protein
MVGVAVPEPGALEELPGDWMSPRGLRMYSAKNFRQFSFDGTKWPVGLGQKIHVDRKILILITALMIF